MSKIVFFIAIIVSFSVACGFGGGEEADPASEQIQTQAQTLPTDAPEPTSTPMPATATPLPAPAPMQELNETSPIDEPDAILRTGSSPIPVPEAGMSPLVEKARAILADKLGVSIQADQITVAAMTEQDWPDSSLGCPEEGQMYMQMITPGYLLMLEMNGQRYEFHADMNENVVACFE